MGIKPVVVIYHGNCTDGFGAAYAAWFKFGNKAEYIEAHYGQPPPKVTGKEVYILDFSYKRDVLLAMHKEAKSLLVLDHHMTAKEDLDGLSFAVFDMNRSGCVMAWEHFHPALAIPWGLKLIQDRDLWRFEMPYTKEFTAAIRAFVEPSFEAWDNVFADQNESNKLVLRGRDLLKLEDKDISFLAQRKHKVTLAGIEGIACNAPSKYASELGNRLAKESDTYAVIYSYDGYREEWQFSLRSVGDYDVTPIAKHYGGGGHKNASGFATKTFINLIQEDKE